MGKALLRVVFSVSFCIFFSPRVFVRFPLPVGYAAFRFSFQHKGKSLTGSKKDKTGFQKSAFAVVVIMEIFLNIFLVVKFVLKLTTHAS